MSSRQVRRIVNRLDGDELAIDRSGGRHSHRYSLPLMNPDKMSMLNPDISKSNVDITVTRNPDKAMSTDPKEQSSITVDTKATTLSGLDLLRDVARVFPPKESQPRYLSLLGDSPNEKLLRECRAEWIDRGYNKISWKWFTEWYAQGGIPERNGKPQTKSKRFTKHGEEILEETEDYISVMGPDGTPSYRGKTAKGMAMHSNYPVKVFEQSFK